MGVWNVHDLNLPYSQVDNLQLYHLSFNSNEWGTCTKKRKTSHFVQTQFHRQCIHMLHTILVKLSSRDQKGGVFKAAMNANTVDGLEIRRSPVEVGSLSHYLRGFIHPRWLFGIPSINSSF